MSYASRACPQLALLTGRLAACGTAPARASLLRHHGGLRPLPPPRNGAAAASRGLVTSFPARRSITGAPTDSDLSRKDHESHEADVRAGIAAATKQQIKRPWQREGADQPPVSDDRKNMNKSMTKGRLLTTPTRLLKLILPLPVDATHDEQGNKGEFRSIAHNEDIQPLALLVHPQQPLSYLERLIQAELPPVYDRDGREKVPNVYFMAEASERDGSGHVVRGRSDGAGDGGRRNVASYSGAGREGARTPAEHQDWVRWSSSTEVGDFIRDAARGREFAVTIDGHDAEMRVDVPSFHDRTHYMRLRLRRLSRRVDEMSRIKQECDTLAHRGAHRLAKAGFGALSAWWATVYFVTFHTDAGWDLVEPVTYLAGLTTIMGGYLWFLFISRDLSYQAALKITVSRRQNVLYQSKGFDPAQWEALTHDANALRREIRIVAEEYDVDYNEARDLGGEEVKEVLEKEEGKRKGRSNEEEDEDDEGAQQKKHHEEKPHQENSQETGSERGR